MATKDWVIEEVTKKFTEFNNSVADAAAKLIISPENFSPTAAAVIHSISSALVGTGIILVGLFFLVDLCNKSLMFEVSNYEVTAKLLLRFLLAKGVVDNSHLIMDWIFSGFAGILATVGSAGNLTLGSNMSQGLVDKINAMDGGVLGINYIMYYLSLQPSMLIIWGASLVCGVIVIGRMFEIMVYSTVAPLPLATLAGEVSHDTAKKFILNYISVCLQGVIILISFRLFGGIMADSFAGNTDMLTYLMLVVVFMLVLFKSGTWAKNIVGVA
jgi:hypothetical protein